MTKFLMAIVLLITGLKYTSGYTIFNDARYDLVKLVLHDDESRQEKGEKEKGKSDNEDKILQFFYINPLSDTTGNVLSIWHQDFYSAYINNAITPPPDHV